MSRLEEMQVFVRVVEAGSLTAAADQLNQAKSAVSRRLAELEKRLGVRLLTRTTRKMSLTEAGQSYLEQARAIIEAADAADAGVRKSADELAGRIRIAAPLSFGISHLGPALQEFSRAHTGVELDLDLNDRQVDLVAEGFDLGIRISQLADSQLSARRLARVRRVIAASPDWWQQHGMPTQPAELADHQHLVYANEGQAGWNYKTPAGRRGTIRLNSRLRANNGEFLRDSAIAGMGVILQPTFLVHRAIEAGELQPALMEFDWRDLDAWAVYPATRFLPARTRALVDALADRFGNDPYWDNCLRG